MKPLVYVVVFLFCAACFKDPDHSEIPASISTPDLNCSCQPTMDAYLWMGKKVYVKTYRGPACNWVPAYFDAEGNPLPVNNHITFQEFMQQATFLKNIWQCG